LILVLLVQIISALSWGMVLLQLGKALYNISKSGGTRPPLLIPLAVASLALFIESIYFGTSAIFKMTGNEFLFDATIEATNWFLVKLLIAVSGVLLLFNLKIDDKK
jgi:hypothetical protein